MEHLIQIARINKVETKFSLKLYNYLLDNAMDQNDYNKIMSNLTMWMYEN